LAAIRATSTRIPDRRFLSPHGARAVNDAGRIRFANRFENSIEDLLANHAQICDGFFEFYPQLQQHVAKLAIESG